MRSSILTLFVVFYTSFLFAQSGAIQGRVYDESTDEGIPFANVALYKGGALKGGATTDMNGKYSIKPVPPGTYDLKVSYVGYQPKRITGIVVAADKTVFQDIPLSKGVKLKEVKVVSYKKPLFEKDQTKVQHTLTSDEIERLPQREPSDIAATSAGVFQKEEGGGLNFRGSRSDANDIYIDGVKVRGSNAVPQSAIDQVSTVTGGIPAKYGDATGGIVNITTKGASSRFSGGGEVQTSQYLDPYGYNLFAGNVSGPLLMESKGEEDKQRSLLGFFVAGEYKYQKDPNPPYYSLYSVRDEVLDSLEKYPIRPNPYGGGYVRSSEFVSKDRYITYRGDTVQNPMEQTAFRQNADRHDLSLTGKIDFAATEDIDVTVGGQVTYADYKDFVYVYSMFNPSGNDHRTNLDWRVYGRFTQRFGGGQQQKKEGEEQEEDQSVVENAYYTIQADYSRSIRKYEHPVHEDDIFKYGYTGKYVTEFSDIYAPGSDSTSGLSSNYVMQDITPSAIHFTPAEINQNTARYNELYYQLTDETPESENQIIQATGVYNGIRPQNVYSMWYNTGRQYNGWGINRDDDQVRLSIDGSADLSFSDSEFSESHSIQFGIEYEQRTDRNYGVNPVGLWTLMRQLANKHLEQLDKQNPTLIIDGKEYAYDDPSRPAFGNNDSIKYGRKYVKADQAYFDKQLRKKLGLPVDGTQWIDIDSLPTSTYSLEMFTPDELVNNASPFGQGYVSYRGYDYAGNKLSKQPSFNDYFTKKDENDNYTRPIGAYQPIYMAAYVQDKFAFRDLIFNVGVRVDRFDANQKVLRDKYSLYPIRSAEEVSEIDGEEVSHPGNIGDEYAVYVDDKNDPTKILGYRDEDTWYDATGEEINNPDVIAEASSDGSINPYLENPDVKIKDEDFDPDKSFKDYEPQVTVMPRIAFSFPISDEATFLAHYDVLTQRPQGRNQATPFHYFYMEERGTRVIPNPNLKPEKTINYEVGFKQKLSRSSALSISGFYKELRDMVQVTKVRFAYPLTYVSFGNIDFGTVKGLTFAYDLRRTKNVQLNVNYTLQFAKGTGSSKTSQFSLVEADNPNIRTILPLDFDQRHTITAILDYRFARGKDYTGPNWFGKDVFEDAGVNFRAEIGSGVPYTQQTAPTREAQFGVAQRSSLEGSINGSRLPWSFRLDGRINKQFNFKVGGGDEKKKKARNLGLNVYLQVQNILNTRNVLRVYSYTGDPDDDGYLSSARGQQFTQEQLDPQAFKDMYQIKMRDYILGGRHYGLPRRIRLGAEFNF